MTLEDAGTAVGLMLLLRFSALYAAGDATPTSRAIARAAPAIAIWTGTFGFLVPALAFWNTSLDDATYRRVAFWFENAHWFGLAVGVLGILAAAVSQYRAAPEELRQRRLLVLAGVSAFATTELIQATLRIVTQADDAASNAIAAGGLAVMGLALAYALLTRNLMDVELVIDRAIVLTVTTLLLSLMVYCAEEFVAPIVVKLVEGAGHVEEHGPRLKLAVEVAVGFPFFLIMHRIYDATVEFVQPYSFASRDLGLRLSRDFRHSIVSLSDDAAIERRNVRGHGRVVRTFLSRAEGPPKTLAQRRRPFGRARVAYRRRRRPRTR